MALRVKMKMGDKSFKKFLKGLDRMDKKTKAALVRAVYLEAEKIMTYSKQLVPVDTGALRASGFVQLPQKVGNRTFIEFGYGGIAQGSFSSARSPKTKTNPNVNYAVLVHEDMNAYHKTGQAKYLEDAIKESKNTGGVNRIAATVRRELKGRI